MSDPLRIALVGASGLVGRAIMEEVIGRDDYRILALARREIGLPAGARMELIVSDPSAWPAILTQLRPDVLIWLVIREARARKAGRPQ